MCVCVSLCGFWTGGFLLNTSASVLGCTCSDIPSIHYVYTVSVVIMTGAGGGAAPGTCLHGSRVRCRKYLVLCFQFIEEMSVECTH